MHKCSECAEDNRCPVYYNCPTCHSKVYCLNCCGCHEREKQVRLQQQREKNRQVDLIKNTLASAQTAQEFAVQYFQQYETEVNVDNDYTVDDVYEVIQEGQSQVIDVAAIASEDDAKSIYSDTDSAPLTRSNSCESVSTVSYDKEDNDVRNNVNQDCIGAESDIPIHQGFCESVLDEDKAGTQIDEATQFIDELIIDSETTELEQDWENWINSPNFNGIDTKADQRCETPDMTATTQNPVLVLGIIPNYFFQLIAKAITVFKALNSKSFINNLTTDLTREEAIKFNETVGKYVVDKLPQVDRSLQKSIIDFYSTHRNLIDPDIIQQTQPSEWVLQSFFRNAIARSTEIDPYLNGFKANWFKFSEQYSIPNQIALLKALQNKENLREYSISDVTNILDYILELGKIGYDLACSDKKDCLIGLKMAWLYVKLVALTDYSFKERDNICSALAETDWNVHSLEQFLKSIEGEEIDAVLNLIKTIKLHNSPESIVLPTITSDTYTEKGKSERWTYSIIGQSILRNISHSEPEIAQSIVEYLNKIVQSNRCSHQLINKVATEHVSLIKTNPAKFSEVLSLLYEYQVNEGMCEHAFTFLSSRDWAKKIDKEVVNKLFQTAQVYTTDELINLIAENSEFFTEFLKSSYDDVSNSTHAAPEVPERYRIVTNLFNGSSSKLCKCNENQLKSWAQQIKKSQPCKISQSELITGVKRAVELHHSNRFSEFKVRDTQLLSLITLLNPAKGRGRLAQINTGEGKSLIVAMLAAIHALQGRKVDIVTTSTELSIPEAKAQKAFFESLSLTVGENSNMATKKSVYKCDVVYGTSGDFQADILQTEFLGKDIRGDRGFEIVIVDEVDSMLFDFRSHSVRLSEQTPGMTHLELPLAAIWEHIHTVAKHLTTIDDKTYFIAEDFERNGNDIVILDSDKDLKSCAVEVSDRQSFISEKTEKHLNHLLRNLNDEELDIYKDYKKLSNEIYNLEKEIANVTKNEDKINLYEKLKEESTKHPWTKHPVIDIPIHLRELARSQIPYWIKSAINAAYGYKKGNHYTIQDNKIVPVNYNETGDLQLNMVWGDGLTQFLQLKEGLPLDPERVPTNFISNVSFFKRYGAFIYGLTGTLGEKSTKKFLFEMYNTDAIVIPPHQHMQILDNSHSSYLCKELTPIILSNEQKWLDTIVNRALRHAQYKRAVLIICKFISQVNNVADKLRGSYDADKIFTYTGEDSFDKLKVDSGEIIVATNIAGRGKDFETSKSVEKHGGLYVAITFMPESLRVEMQNVGRTARAGNKGMAQLIMCNPVRPDIKEIRENRQAQEDSATKKALQDATKTILQDKLFEKFCCLERKYLPPVGQIYLLEKWRNLKCDWSNHVEKNLSPVKVKEEVDKMERSRYIELLKSLTINPFKVLINSSGITEMALKHAAAERSKFEEEYKKRMVNLFYEAQAHVPHELITCFKEGKDFEPAFTKLAKKHDWGLYDRKGLEEYWGFWLKSKNFADNSVSLEDALKCFDNEFAVDFEARAKTDQLVRNPYYYVLKGNAFLIRGNKEPNSATIHYDKAIACYDRAIKMDPDFSVNARYNKAQALLSYKENKGERQDLAFEELKKALDIISTISRPAILTLGALVRVNGTDTNTTCHAHHQLNVISQQENYITMACSAIEGAKAKGYNVKLSTRFLPETLNSPGEKDSKLDHSKAVAEATNDGFTYLFMVHNVEPYPWGSIVGMALLSLAQITAGALITACTGGALGVGLIFEGVFDMMTTIKAAIKGSFDWAMWGVQKAITLALAIVTCGVEGLKAGYKAVALTVEDLVITGVGATKKGVELAAKTIGVAIGKGILRECLTKAGKYCLDKVFMEGIEKIIQTRVEKTVSNESLSKNNLLNKALEIDRHNGNNVWQNRLIEEGLTFLKEGNDQKFVNLLRTFVHSDAFANAIPGSVPLLEMAQVMKLIGELENCTKNFNKNLNEKILAHKHDIEAAHQKIQSSKVTSSNSNKNMTFESQNINSTNLLSDSSVVVLSTTPHSESEDIFIPIDSNQGATNYSSKSVPSASESKTHFNGATPSDVNYMADIFQKRLTSELICQVRETFTPIIQCAAGFATKAVFHHVDKSLYKLRKEVKRDRDLRFHRNILANASGKDIKREEKNSVRKNTPISRENKKGVELNESARMAVERLEGDVALDANDLALAAAVVDAPIRVYDRNTGRLVDVIGDKLPGKPISIEHSSSGSYWGQLGGDSSEALSNGNNCLLDVIFPQIDGDKREEIGNVYNLKANMIKMVHSNPAEANKAYEFRDKFGKIGPDKLGAERWRFGMGKS